MLKPDRMRKDRPYDRPRSHSGCDDLHGRCVSLDGPDGYNVTQLVSRWCCHVMRGHLEAASISKLIAL